MHNRWNVPTYISFIWDITLEVSDIFHLQDSGG